jgi:hypothetical protein
MDEVDGVRILLGGPFGLLPKQELIKQKMVRKQHIAALNLF